jgi:hypothetical protein
VSHTYTLPLPAYSIATADFNGDGKLDLVFITSDPITGNWSFYVMLGNGDGSFGSPTAFPQGVPGQPGISIVVADCNGDHKPDLLVLAGTLNVFLGKGDGTFAPAVSYFAGAGPTSFVVGDFNNDGIADAAVASSAGIGILLGKGDGSFQAATFPVSGVTQVFAVADLNGDGAADLVASANGKLQVLLGSGNGTFQALPSANQTISNVVAVADVNLDGKLDLVAGNGLNVFLGNGDGTFGIPIVIVPAAGDVSQQAMGSKFVLIADYNHDKRADVAVDVEGPTSGVVSLLNISQLPAPDFQITASVPSPATVAPGSSATSTVTLTPIGGFAGGVTLTCSGAPSGSTCTVSSTPLQLSGSPATATVTITTTAPSKGTLLPFGNDAPRTMSYRPTPLLFTLLSIAALLSLFLWRRDQRLRAVPALTFALLLCLGSTMTSCGGGSSGGGGGTVVTGTQAGTYTITVSASATAGSTTLSHSAKLTLVVQ